jgi:hypothetical protein
VPLGGRNMDAWNCKLHKTACDKLLRYVLLRLKNATMSDTLCLSAKCLRPIAPWRCSVILNYNVTIQLECEFDPSVGTWEYIHHTDDIVKGMYLVNTHFDS